MSKIVVLLFPLLAGLSKSSGTCNSTDQKSDSRYLYPLQMENAGIFDVNTDGKISVADAELASENFTRVLGLKCDEKKRLTEEKINSTIRSYLLWNGQEVPENEYGVLQRDAYLEDKTIFREKVQECLKQIIDIVDINNDFFISEEELIAIEMAFNFKDKKRDKAYFESLRPEAKGIPLQKHLEDLLSYYGDDDCSRDELQHDPLKSQLSD